MEKKWHMLPEGSIFETLSTSSNGLTVSEVTNRIKQYGLNTLPEKKPPTYFRLFLGQFNSPLILILLVASAVTFLIGEIADATIILFVLVFNAIVGTVQEGKAQNTLSALKKFVETKANVIRNGKETVISDVEIVPGDIVDLQEGDKIPADGRVIMSQGLKVDEASLTGESEPVLKSTDILEKDSATIGDQKNMVFKGTHVVAGNGKVIIVATGAHTVIGNIAEKISTMDSDIPLKKNIAYLSRAIIVAVAIISLCIFSIGINSGESVRDMFLVVVSLAVSTIPEGLPIVITLVLASGVWRMSKRNALVKKLQAVEALGQAQVIAVDKTGTITKNELVVQQVWTAGKLFEVDGVGYEPVGGITLDSHSVDVANHADLLALGKAVALCADARLSYSEEDKKWNIVGDPTEAAMVVFTEKINLHKESLVHETPQVFEIPFDYKLKYRTVVNTFEGKNFQTVIGAPEVLIHLSTHIQTEKGKHLLTKDRKAELEAVLVDMSEKGYRVVAIGQKHNVKESSEVSGLTFLGFLAMKDILRSEVKDAMERAQAAGIRVVMITGDYEITARAIAREAGIFHPGDKVMTGVEVEKYTEEELSREIEKVTVFARVTPEHKLKIIDAFKLRGEIIAMTGDGVNDAPSLVAANLGVAMGGIGTEVAKEAADIVLLDDNFGSIVSAVEEGRAIYKSIKKVILYLFSTSIGEVLTIAVALLMGLPLPILAAQIIWLNFVTDGFLDVSLAMEPKEAGLLNGTFKKPNKFIVDRLMLLRMFTMALPMMLGTIFLFYGYAVLDLEKSWTISLTALAMFQWFNAWNCRSETKSIFSQNPFTNKYLVGATIIVVTLQILAVYTAPLQHILHTVPLSLEDWLTVIPVALSIVLVEEVRKLLFRKFAK